MPTLSNQNNDLNRIMKKPVMEKLSMKCKNWIRVGLPTLLAAFFAAIPAYAAPVINKGDTTWMMTATVLVLVMTVPGLSLFYGGLVRSKNMLSMLTQVDRKSVV